MTADWRLAVDIGGTFTDVVLFDGASGRVVVDKTLTTPSACSMIGTSSMC